jgi:hypothetical protein
MLKRKAEQIIARTAVQYQRKFSRRQLVIRAAPRWCSGKQNNIKVYQGQQCSTKDKSVEDNMLAEQHHNGAAESRTAF